MASINDIVSSAQGGQLIDNLSRGSGLATWQTEAAVRALTPALSAALIRAASDADSLRPILEAARDPLHKAAFDSEHSPESVEAAGVVVEHLFGPASAAGQVSQLAARESGLRADVLQQLLPVLVSVLAGGLSPAIEGSGLSAALEGAAARVAPPVEEKPAKSGLAALFGGLLAAFAGGKKPAPPAQAEPSGADALRAALERIRDALQSGEPVGDDHRAELDELLARLRA